MGSAEEFVSRSRQLAKRFVRTAILVDDEAYIEGGRDQPTTGLVAPGRRPPTSGEEDRSQVSRRAGHALNAGDIMDSFSRLGVICGVVGPSDAAMETMRQADIVILDWHLQVDDPRRALNLLRKLLTGEAERNSLRLVAIYTGDAGLEGIREDVCAELKNNGLEPEKNQSGLEISYRHGRVVLYAKSDVNLVAPLKVRSVAEADIPKRLVEDFATMTAGLLPAIALTALTAVREGEHKILDRFRAELDPAYLSHMTCLPDPADSESQMVIHVAEELRGLVDEAVATESPAGARAVESRLRHDKRTEFTFGDWTLDLEQTIQLATKGLGACSALKNSAFTELSKGFDCLGIADIDKQLAWMMSFRTVYNAPPPRLWLGSVATTIENGSEQHLICMRPRCDSVRLEEKTTFIFLPLVEPSKTREQIVVRIGDKFKRLGIRFDPADWVLRQFKPSKDSRTVVAKKHGSDFEFKDTERLQYKWRGELKVDYAQRIAQKFAEKLSRVAVDESEWLRRKARSGK